MFWMELLFLSERIRFFVKVSFAGVEVTILVFLHAGLDKRVLCVLSAPCRGGPQVPLHQWVQTGVGASWAAVGARWTAWSTAAFLCMCVEMHVQTLELGGVCLGFTAAPQLPPSLWDVCKQTWRSRPLRLGGHWQNSVKVELLCNFQMQMFLLFISPDLKITFLNQFFPELTSVFFIFVWIFLHLWRMLCLVCDTLCSPSVLLVWFWCTWIILDKNL